MGVVNVCDSVISAARQYVHTQFAIVSIVAEGIKSAKYVASDVHPERSKLQCAVSFRMFQMLAAWIKFARFVELSHGSMKQ
jgi:hypothetical protein